jgi:hypothetical protein
MKTSQDYIMQDEGGCSSLTRSQQQQGAGECRGKGNSLADKVARPCHCRSVHLQHNALGIKSIIQVSVLIPTIQMENCSSQ